MSLLKIFPAIFLLITSQSLWSMEEDETSVIIKELKLEGECERTKVKCLECNTEFGKNDLKKAVNHLITIHKAQIDMTQKGKDEKWWQWEILYHLPLNNQCGYGDGCSKTRSLNCNSSHSEIREFIQHIKYIHGVNIHMEGMF